jgi:hypothetical protein
VAPELGDLRGVHRIAGRGGEHVESFRIRGHDAVLDPVVDHLHEVARAHGAAMQVALLVRSQCPEDRIEPLHRGFLAADHQAVAVLQAPHPAARADVDVLDPARGQLVGANDVIGVVRVAAVDHDVALLQERRELRDHGIHQLVRNHDPDRARRFQLLHQRIERFRRHGPVARHRVDGSGHHVVDDALMSRTHEPPRDVRPHPSEADDSQLHGFSFGCCGHSRR